MTGTCTRACPLCDGNSYDPIRSVNGWVIATCGQCGFVYAPVVRVHTATELNLPSDYQPVWRARHRQIARLLNRHLRDGDLVVDVGAGFGELGLVVGNGGRFRYLGFEPSLSIAAAAGRRGVDLRPEFFRPGAVADAGAVVLDNVIEHVDAPVPLLEAAAGALRPGGLLVVIVPNRWDVRQVIPRWRDANHWIPPEHINYFTPRVLGHVLSRMRLDVRPFGFAALGRDDWRYWPRAVLERIGVYPFGINMYGVKV